jgi:hypothetical protein
MLAKIIPEPWLSFLREIDTFVDDETHLHCLGGFVVTLVYGSPRETSDIDSLTLVRHPAGLYQFAGIGSDLFKRYGVYLDPVGVATLPDNYEDRLAEIFPATFDRLRLFALDPYDIALSKLERNADIDRQDILHLAQVVPFDLQLLQQRYADELLVYLGNSTSEDLTLKLWIDMINETRQQLDR